MNLVINIWTFLYLIIGISIVSVIIYVLVISKRDSERRHDTITVDVDDDEAKTASFVSNGHPEECLNRPPEFKQKGFFSKLFNGNDNDPKVVSRKVNRKTKNEDDDNKKSSFMKNIAKLGGGSNNIWIKGILDYTGLKDYLGFDDKDVEEFLESHEDDDDTKNEDANDKVEGWVKRRKKASSKSQVHYISAECAYAGEDVDVHKNSNHALNVEVPLSLSSVAASAPKPFRFFAKSSTDFRKIGLEAFKGIIKEYGGNISKIKENVKLTSQKFNVDLYYEEGIHKIGIDFKPIHYSIYPNSIHKTKSEFENFVREEDFKKLIAYDEEKIYLIFVPYTVDQCISLFEETNDINIDETTATKWIHESGNASEKERHYKIRRDLYKKLVEYYETLTSGYYF